MSYIERLGRWALRQAPASLFCFAGSVALAGLLLLAGGTSAYRVFGQSGWILVIGLAWAGAGVAAWPAAALQPARLLGCLTVYAGLATGEALNAGASGPWLGRLLVGLLRLPAGSVAATLVLAAAALGVGLPLWSGRRWPDLLEKWGEQIEGAGLQVLGMLGNGPRQRGPGTAASSISSMAREDEDAPAPRRSAREKAVPGDASVPPLASMAGDLPALSPAGDSPGQFRRGADPEMRPGVGKPDSPAGCASPCEEEWQIPDAAPEGRVAADLAWIQQNLERRYRKSGANAAPIAGVRAGETPAVMMDVGEIRQRLMKIHGGRIPGDHRRRASQEPRSVRAMPLPPLMPAGEPTLRSHPGRQERRPAAAHPAGHSVPHASAGRPVAAAMPPAAANAGRPLAPPPVAGPGAASPAAAIAPAMPVFPAEGILSSRDAAPAFAGSANPLIAGDGSAPAGGAGSAAVPERVEETVVLRAAEPEPEAEEIIEIAASAPVESAQALPPVPAAPLAAVFLAPPAQAAAGFAASDERGAAEEERAPPPIQDFAAMELPQAPPDGDGEDLPGTVAESGFQEGREADFPPGPRPWDGYDPPLGLLQAPASSLEPINHEELARQGRLIQEKLAEFKVNVVVQEACAGPVITRYEVEPAVGVRGSQVVNLMKDLARALGVTAIRVVETIPGKTYMGLELPNPRRQMIRLSEVLSSQVFQSHGSKLAMALGKDITGNPVVADLAKAPHMLVAGTTGSGKSVGVNAMILSLLYRASPDEVRFVMIDPKMLELSVYDGIPHLLAPVVTDMKLAANALNWCVTEMERRYRLMSALGVRNLAGYNQKVVQAREAGRPLFDPFPLVAESPAPLEPLPFIVVVVDEFADLMMVAGKKIEELIARLAQKARAAGIHLILATQRPSVDVITGLIKANIPTRIAFQVSSKVDSRTILDQMGAETLLGQGDMLYLPPGTGYPQRVHGAFVADEEVHALAEHLKRYGPPDYVEAVLGGAPEGEQAELEGAAEETDPLYDQAVAIVIDSRRASISLIQRHLRIGYNRAARLVEQMEVAGVVSPMESNGSRTVLVPAA